MKKIISFLVLVISVIVVRSSFGEEVSVSTEVVTTPIISSDVASVSISTSAEVVISTPTVSVDVVAVSVDSTTAKILGVTEQTPVSVHISTEADNLSSLIIEDDRSEETQFQKVGKSEMIKWKEKLQVCADKLDLQVIKFADKGAVTTYGVQNIVDDYKKYKELKSGANERLSFFGLNIAENQWEAEYEKFEAVPLYLNADDKNQNIRRFFINKTGKDIVVKKGAAFNIWMGTIGSVVTWFLITVL